MVLVLVGPKPYEFIGFGDIHGPKPYKFIGFGDIHGPSGRRVPARRTPRSSGSVRRGAAAGLGADGDQGPRNPYLLTIPIDRQNHAF